jgi:hypothetical protein
MLCKPNTDSFGPKECGGIQFEYQITSTIKGSFSAGYGQFTHDSNPNVSINNDAVATVENTTRHSLELRFKKIQTSWHATAGFGLGIDYRDPKYWWVGININYLADSYIDISQ